MRHYKRDFELWLRRREVGLRAKEELREALVHFFGPPRPTFPGPWQTGESGLRWRVTSITDDVMSIEAWKVAPFVLPPIEVSISLSGLPSGSQT